MDNEKGYTLIETVISMCLVAIILEQITLLGVNVYTNYKKYVVIERIESQANITTSYIEQFINRAVAVDINTKEIDESSLSKENKTILGIPAGYDIYQLDNISADFKGEKSADLHLGPLDSTRYKNFLNKNRGKKELYYKVDGNATSNIITSYINNIYVYNRGGGDTGMLVCEFGEAHSDERCIRHIKLPSLHYKGELQ